MSIFELATFCVVVGVTAALPGPDIAAIFSRGLSRRAQDCVPFIIGIIFGHNLWLLLAAAGLVALISSFSSLLVLIKFAAVIYLLYLAWGLWNASAGELEIANSKQHSSGTAGFFAGVLVSLTNPKAMVFFAAVLPTVITLKNLSLFSLAIVMAAMSLVLFAVFFSWALLSARAGAMMKNVSGRKLMNRIAAACMAGAAAVVAAR